MKRLMTIAAVFTIMCLQAQNSFLGKWKAIDDLTGKPLAVIDLFEINDKIYGRVIEITNPKNRHVSCEKCEGEDNMKPVLGLVVIKGLSKDGDEYSGGKILDPKTGKLYKCYVSLENNNKLKVRGYVGFSLFGRTQYWHRVRE